eukprot:scaffold67547_cov18-Tisochrysis_lutea.AAC.1
MHQFSQGRTLTQRKPNVVTIRYGLDALDPRVPTFSQFRAQVQTLLSQRPFSRDQHKETKEVKDTAAQPARMDRPVVVPSYLAYETVRSLSGALLPGL